MIAATTTSVRLGTDNRSVGLFGPVVLVAHRAGRLPRRWALRPLRETEACVTRARAAATLGKSDCAENYQRAAALVRRRWARLGVSVPWGTP